MKKSGIRGVLFVFISIVLLISMSVFVSAFVRINEIMYAPSTSQGSDSFNEWIEIFNNGTSPINLTNFNLCGKTLLEGFVNRSGDTNLNTSFILNSSKFALITDGDTGTEVYANFSVNSDALALHVDAASLCSGNQLSGSGDVLNLSNGIYSHVVDYTPFVTLFPDTNNQGKTLIFYKGNFTESAFVNGTPGATNDQFAPDFNKWINPDQNNSLASVRVNITVNITDVTGVNASLVDFNGTNFSMTQSGDLWFFLWNISKNIDKVHNITVYFNDSNGFASSDTIFNITVGRPPEFNKWVNPSANNSFVKGLVNITANITDVASSVNVALVNFNNSNFSMTQSGDLFFFIWNTSLNEDRLYNITIFFNDTLGFSNTDTLFNITVDNTKPRIQDASTSANSRNFVSPGFVFNASVNATDVNLFNVTCALSGTTVGNFSRDGDIHVCNLTAPSTESDFEIVITVIDKANNTNTTTISFSTKHTTSAELLVPDVTITDVNNSDKTINVEAVLNNTGQSTIFESGVRLVALSLNFPGSILTDYAACSENNLSVGQSCNATLSIKIDGGSKGTFNTFWNANWTNANFTPQTLQSNILSSVTISANPIIDVPQNISVTINHGTNKNITLHVNSTGNVDLNDVNITFVPINLSQSQITFISANQIATITSNNETVNITVNVPQATNPGTYEGLFNITANSSEFKVVKMLVNVPQDTTWTSFPSVTNIFKRSTESGTAATIFINNTGNVDANFSISYAGRLFDFLMLSPVVVTNDLFVNKSSLNNFTIDHNSDGPFIDYNLTVTITNQLTSEINISIVNLTHDDNNPNVNITNPINNSFVKGTIEFNVSATDLNLSRLEYFINNSLVFNSSEINFTFNWNTANGSFPDDSYILKVIAVDSASNFNQSEINVTVNNTDDDPIFIQNIPTINIIEDNDSTILNLSLFFTTIDGESFDGQDFRYNFTQPDNVTVHVNNITQIANFSPQANFSGTNFIIFTAIDSSLNTTSSNNVTIDVKDVNDAPTTPNLVSPEDNSIVKSATGAVTLIWNDSIEVDNEPVTYFIFFSNDSSNIALNATTLQTSLQFDGLENDTYFWNVIAGDGSLNSSASPTFQFKLNLDSKPNITFWQWNNTLIISAKNTTNNLSPIISENSTLAFIAEANDPDGDDINFTWLLNNAEKSNTQNFIFNFTNNFTSAGIYNITLIVQDNNTNEDRETWNLTVTNFNRIPQLVQIPDKNIVEESSDTIINLSEFFSDEDADDTLTFLVALQNTSEVKCSINVNNLTLIGALNFAGNESNAAKCSIVAFDGIENSTENIFSINVSNVNDVPVLDTIGSLTAEQGTLFFFDVNASDADGDAIVFSSNSTLFNISSSSGTFNFTPINDQVGSHTINITVNDTTGSQDTKIITLTVINLNDAPVLDTIEDQNAIEDDILEFNISASDIDEDALTFTSNSSMSFANAANNSFATASFTPNNDDVGTNVVNITVSDGSLADSQLITIIVTNTNDAPTITSFSPEENKTIAPDVGSQEFIVTFVDVDVGDSPTSAWFRNGTSIAPVNSSNVTVAGLNVGIFNITVVVTDLDGLTARNEWVLTVSGDINATDLTSNVLDLNEEERQSATNVVVSQSTFGDIDFGNEILNFSGVVLLEDAFNISQDLISVDTDRFPGLNGSASLLMKGLNFTKAPLIFNASRFESKSGGDLCPSSLCNNISYDVANGILRFNVAHFTTFFATTNTTNGAPQITSTPVTTGITNERYEYNVDAFDPDGDALIFSLIENPTGMSINSNSGLITFTPTTLGTSNVTVQVSDGSLTDTQTYNLIITEGNKLRITDLDVRVDGKSDKNLKNNSKISKEAQPGSRVKFDIEVENFFTKAEDMEITNIEVEITIRDIDDDDDLDEDADDFDLDPGENDNVDIEFDIPIEVEEGNFDVIIEIEGIDENGTDHEIRFELRLEVEKENHEIRIIRSSLSPQIIKCERAATFNIEIINTGQDDEEDVTLEILSPELGINSLTTEIELDEGTDDNRFSQILTKTVREDVVSGTYPITVNTYYDNKLSDTETVSLTVQDCERVIEIKEEVKEEKPDVQVIRPDTVKTVKPVPTVEISFVDTNEYVVLLAIMLIIFIGTAVFIIGAGFILLRK